MDLMNRKYYKFRNGIISIIMHYGSISSLTDTGARVDVRVRMKTKTRLRC